MTTNVCSKVSALPLEIFFSPYNGSLSNPKELNSEKGFRSTKSDAASQKCKERICHAQCKILELKGQCNMKNRTFY